MYIWYGSKDRKRKDFPLGEICRTEWYVYNDQWGKRLQALDSPRMIHLWSAVFVEASDCQLLSWRYYWYYLWFIWFLNQEQNPNPENFFSLWENISCFIAMSFMINFPEITCGKRLPLLLGFAFSMYGFSCPCLPPQPMASLFSSSARYNKAWSLPS